MIGIIGAMDVEVDGFKNLMEDVEVMIEAKKKFYVGKLHGKDVVISESGIGKVNAAVSAQILIDRFNIDCLINSGIAGSLNDDIHIFDIVVSNTVYQHDFDIRFFGYRYGEVPGVGSVGFEADRHLIDVAKNAIKESHIDVDVFEGNVLSGDQFIETDAKKQEITSLFDGDCADMESGGIAQVAKMQDVPFVVIRTISDNADDNASEEYKEDEAAAHSIEVLNEIIKEL